MESGTTAVAPRTTASSALADRRLPLRRQVVGAYEETRSILFSLPAIVLLGVFLLWPLLWVVGMSFTSWDGFGPIHWAGLNTWDALFADSTFRAALRNTVLWVALSATIPGLVGFCLALTFSRSGRILGTLGRAISILPLLLPLTVTTVTFGIIYDPNVGPLNRFLAMVGLPHPAWLGDPNLAIWSLFVVILWSSMGLSVLVFDAAMRSIDRSYFDLAQVEGAGSLSVLRLVVIPACRKAAALAVVVTVVIAGSTFDLLYLVTNATNNTIMLPLDMYNRAFGLENVSAGAADATIEIGIGVVLACLAFLLSGSNPGMSGEAPEGQPSRPVAMVLAALASLVIALPLLCDLSSALSSGVSAMINPPTFPWPPSLSAFSSAWNSGLGLGLWNSFLIALAVAALTVFLSLPAAFALSGPRVSALVRRTVLAVLVFCLLLPGEPYLIPLSYLVQWLPFGDLPGLILAESAREIPFAVLLTYLFINVLPPDVLGAAELEAGRGLRLLGRIIAPMTAPIVAAVGLWVFITSWSETTLPNIILNSSLLSTAPVALQKFGGNVDTQVNLLGAGSLLLVAPVALALILAYGLAGRGLGTLGKNLVR